MKMRFLKNNDNGKLKPVVLQCKSCDAKWEPFGRAGLNTCTECGNTWAQRGFKRIR